MPQRPKLLKYYLFFGVLMLAAIAAVAFTISTASDSKTDKATAEKISEISTKLDTFISNNSQVPATLDDAGVNNVPSSISYKKISDSEYKICATYKAAAMAAAL